MKRKKIAREQIVFNGVGGMIIGIIAAVCLLPLILIISGSFSEESQIITSGYSLLPRGFSLDAYKSVFKNPENILYGYRNTVLYTIVGTGLGLFITSMTAYVLSRKYFPWRNFFAMFFYFTTIFSGGLVPTYLLFLSLGLKNSPWAVIMPSLLSVFNIMIMRNFIAFLPDALGESAKIDGANEFIIYSVIYLPLLKPALATVGLFLALTYWNSWYSCMLYITEPELFTLQYNLYRLLNDAAEISKLLSMGAEISTDMIPPAETVKLATTCVVTGPIILLYPFVQKYFVKGITVGAVKG